MQRNVSGDFTWGDHCCCPTETVLLGFGGPVGAACKCRSLGLGSLQQQSGRSSTVHLTLWGQLFEFRYGHPSHSLQRSACVLNRTCMWHIVHIVQCRANRAGAVEVVVGGAAPCLRAGGWRMRACCPDHCYSCCCWNCMLHVARTMGSACSGAPASSILVCVCWSTPEWWRCAEDAIAGPCCAVLCRAAEAVNTCESRHTVVGCYRSELAPVAPPCCHARPPSQAQVLSPKLLPFLALATLHVFCHIRCMGSVRGGGDWQAGPSESGTSHVISPSCAVVGQWPGAVLGAAQLEVGQAWRWQPRHKQQPGDWAACLCRACLYVTLSSVLQHGCTARSHHYPRFSARPALPARPALTRGNGQVAHAVPEASTSVATCLDS
jgi:hypothetical protein